MKGKVGVTGHAPPRLSDKTVYLQNMSVSGSWKCTFLKIYWAGNHQKGAISGSGNLLHPPICDSAQGKDIIFRHEKSSKPSAVAFLGNSEFPQIERIKFAQF